MPRFIFSLIFLTLATTIVSAQAYDLVLESGRVMDPETGLDAVRSVAIREGKIIRISSDLLTGKRVIHAKGLVVAPGFIDLHQHGQEMESQRLKALDGVTTALELEIGAPDVAQFLEAKQGRSLIHYGTSASHAAARAVIFGAPLPAGEILPKNGRASDQPANEEQIGQIEERLRSELNAGALAIGMGIQYTPAATRLEVIDMFRLAAERRVPVYTHVRSSSRVDPGSAIESISEVIGASAITGAALHIVHVNSSCLRDALECLSLIEGARARGLDVTTEAYPYIAGMTFINSALFGPGWQERGGGISYGDLVLPETGEHLTKERFDELHNSSVPRTVLVFSNSQQVIDQVIPQPLVMIASDGLPGHPRNAGTYSRVLAQYVREKGTITLMDALRKMSLMPAQMLERSTPAARQKGRLQEGADAIVVFDAATIADRATFEKPKEPSIGVHYLLVAGTVVVDDGRIVPDVFPGRAMLGQRRLGLQQ